MGLQSRMCRVWGPISKRIALYLTSGIPAASERPSKNTFRPILNSKNFSIERKRGRGGQIRGRIRAQGGSLPPRGVLTQIPFLENFPEFHRPTPWGKNMQKYFISGISL